MESFSLRQKGAVIRAPILFLPLMMARVKVQTQEMFELAETLAHSELPGLEQSTVTLPEKCVTNLGRSIYCKIALAQIEHTIKHVGD